MATVDDMRLPNRADMDDESYGIALQLMLEDAHQLAEGKGKQKEGTKSDTQVAFDLFAHEIQNALTIDVDHRVTMSIHQALSTDVNAISQMQHEERMARHDHQVALALSQGRVPPPMPLSIPPPPPAPKQVPETASLPAVDAKESLGKKPSNIEPVDAEEPPQTVDVDCTRQSAKGKELETAFAQHTEIRRPEALNSHDDTDDELILQCKPAKPGESSSWAARRKPTPTHRPCTSCMVPTPELRMMRGPCSHEYCHDCIERLFSSAMLDETLFPPGCCKQVIPAEQHLQILGQDLVDLYHAKQIEFSTKDRTYCHIEICGAFIKPVDVGYCSSCDSHTCVSCKKAAHAGDCPQDDELRRVLEMARQEGWRRCTKCNTMVELLHGCNHMTCRCKHQFCYACGVEWTDPRGCRCPLWHEANLIGARRQPQPQQDVVGERQAHHQQALNLALRGPIRLRIQRPGLVQRRAQPQQQVIERRRDRHLCPHDGDWSRLRGDELQDELECDSCNHRLPNYLFVCDRCSLQVCRRCRFNRR